MNMSNTFISIMHGVECSISASRYCWHLRLDAHWSVLLIGISRGASQPPIKRFPLPPSACYFKSEFNGCSGIIYLSLALPSQVQPLGKGLYSQSYTAETSTPQPACQISNNAKASLPSSGANIITRIEPPISTSPLRKSFKFQRWRFGHSLLRARGRSIWACLL